MLTEYSNNMDDIYKSIEKYNPIKKRRILAVFDDMIADMIVTELLITGRILNISLFFIPESYFAVPKNIRLNSKHYFIMKIRNKQEFQQTAFSHLSDTDLQEFMNLYKKCIVKPYCFLVMDCTLALDSPLHFKENLLKRI